MSLLLFLPAFYTGNLPTPYLPFSYVIWHASFNSQALLCAFPIPCLGLDGLLLNLHSFMPFSFWTFLYALNLVNVFYSTTPYKRRNYLSIGVNYSIFLFVCTVCMYVCIYLYKTDGLKNNSSFYFCAFLLCVLNMRAPRCVACARA